METSQVSVSDADYVGQGAQIVALNGRLRSCGETGYYLMMDKDRQNLASLRLYARNKR